MQRAKELLRIILIYTPQYADYLKGLFERKLPSKPKRVWVLFKAGNGKKPVKINSLSATVCMKVACIMYSMPFKKTFLMSLVS